MTNNEKIMEEISRHLNATYPQTRKKVEENPEYKAALKKGDLETARKLAYALIYGNAETKKQHRRLLENKKVTDDILDI
jgi:hypothetical protein